MTGLKPIGKYAQAFELERAAHHLRMAAEFLVTAGWSEDSVLALAGSYEAHASLISQQEDARLREMEEA